MVIQTTDKLDKEEKPTSNDEFYNLNSEIDKRMCEKDGVTPYEKKYYALLSRCETIKQSNERLVNRIYHVKKLLRRKRKERKFLMTRLDTYGDDYKNVSLSLFAEVFGDCSPVRPSCPEQNQLQSSQGQPLVQPKIEVGL